MCTVDSAEIKQFILNINKPVVFKQFIGHWDLLKWDLKEWQTKFDDKMLPFRIGTKKSNKIQWEQNCDSVKMTFKTFLSHFENANKDNWCYFDYKYMQEWFNQEINNHFDWGSLGFPGLDEHDTTIWIGSEGAHTNCHVDSYGCNLVAQIYGQKQWILLPPDEIANCKPTRVPYEESSIYSDLNFYSPKDLIDFADIKNARVIVLNPGDVLLVPKKWLHYVENLTTAISINTWIQLETDEECRLEEALVRLFIAQMAGISDFPKKLLNPNEDQLLSSNATNDMVKYLNYTKEKLEAKPETRLNILDSVNEEPSKKVFKLSTNETEIKALINKLLSENEETITEIQSVNNEELLNVLSVNSSRYEQRTDQEQIEAPDTIKCLINSFCNPEIIASVKDLFLNKTINKQ